MRTSSIKKSVGPEALITPIEGNLFFVAGEGNGKFPACHGFLLKGRENVLIDAGMGLERLAELDRKHRIDVLIITHSHPDHIRHGFYLQDRRIMMPQETPESVSDLCALGERFMGTRKDGEEWASFVSEEFGVRALRLPDERFGDGDVLELGGCRLQAIHAPGHLLDHYCFLELNSGTLITTDIDLTAFGPWCGNPESDLELFKESVKRVMSVPHRRVCSSHKAPIEGPGLRWFQTFLQAFDRQKKLVLDLCDVPMTLDQLARKSPFYRNTLKYRNVQFLFERQMIMKHLSALQREGLVRESNGLYRRVG
uniref:MBL fold metallo-hydrolase n=1 Tax=Desulfomonile tiedjei TaxID=2358 RepID=A0A7C4ETS2_9BACT